MTVNSKSASLHCICNCISGALLRIIRIFSLGLCAVIGIGMLTACDESLTESPIPLHKVTYNCNITTINAAMGQANVPNLDTQPGYVLINGYRNVSEIIGVAGLLLYHSAFEDVFYAYDLACPYCWQQQQKPVQIGMKDDFTAQCAGCQSEFGAVQYGSPAPTAGPANKENLILRQYKAHLAGYNTLVVSN